MTKIAIYLLLINIVIGSFIWSKKQIDLFKCERIMESKTDFKDKLKIEPATIQEADQVDDLLGEYNNEIVPFTQKPNPILKNYIIRDNGKIVAGIKAEIYHWKILYVSALYVDKDYRGKGLGSALLSKVENEAKELGSTLVHFDTFDFQAKDFYLKHGYEIFGTLENCPKGHKRYYLKKNL